MSGRLVRRVEAAVVTRSDCVFSAYSAAAISATIADNDSPTSAAFSGAAAS